jgi:hypothetical protein
VSTPAERLLVFDTLVRPFMEARRAYESARHELSIWGGLVQQDDMTNEEHGKVVRGDGEVICDRCGMEVRKHPEDPRSPDCHVRCDGLRIHT